MYLRIYTRCGTIRNERTIETVWRSDANVVTAGVDVLRLKSASNLYTMNAFALIVRPIIALLSD